MCKRLVTLGMDRTNKLQSDFRNLPVILTPCLM
jgi:hypothetical protein